MLNFVRLALERTCSCRRTNTAAWLDPPSETVPANEPLRQTRGRTDLAVSATGIAPQHAQRLSLDYREARPARHFESSVAD